jgi:Flp pilus assembly protein TadG
MKQFKTHSPAGSGGMVKALLKRFCRDRRGVGAVEFAIIVPLLLMIYISSVELTIGYGVAKRATRAAGTIADNVAQQSKINKAYLKTMNDAAAAIFAPSSTSDLKLKLSGIGIDAAGKATILWSWSQDNTRPYAVGSLAAVPTELKKPDSTLVHAEVTVPHELLMFMPGLVPSQIRTISIGREYYLRQRPLGDSVVCSDC